MRPTHIVSAHGEGMDKPTTYEIVIRGRATERLLGPLVDDFVVDHPARSRTRLAGVIRDPAHLHGVMAHLTSVAAEIISLTPTDPDPTNSSNPNNDQSKERPNQ